MPINSRNKGAAFERLIVRMINECFEREGIKDRVSRNFDQSWKGGLADIYYRNFAIECKDTNKQILICTAKNGGNKF